MKEFFSQRILNEGALPLWNLATWLQAPNHFEKLIRIFRILEFYLRIIQNSLDSIDNMNTICIISN